LSNNKSTLSNQQEADTKWSLKNVKLFLLHFNTQFKSNKLLSYMQTCKVPSL